MQFEAILILIVMVLTAGMDAARDAWVVRKNGVGWWQWHVVKWTAFYAPFILLGYFYFECCGWSWPGGVVFVAVCGICWWVWKMVYSVSK